MNYNELIGLVQTFDKSSLTKLKFEESGQLIVLEKGHSHHVVQNMTQPSAETRFASIPVVEMAGIENPAAEMAKANTTFEEITAPLVGIFYGSAAPGDDAFVKIGDQVKAGAPLCILEAMKVMNEVVAPYDLVVKEICVSNEALVEFGQPLFKVEKA